MNLKIAQTMWGDGQIVGKRHVLRRSKQQNWCLNHVLYKKYLNENIPSSFYILGFINRLHTFDYSENIIAFIYANLL